MRGLGLWVLPVLIVGCSSISSLLPDTTSVETVLRNSVDVAELLDEEERQRERDEGRKPASKLRPRLQRPLKKARINSKFGPRRGVPHTGVDLDASPGTQIYAAEKGIVVFAGANILGYGHTVIIRHIGGIATLYAHASVLHVQVGERVEKGQFIAYSGESGNATGPHLHFEVRVGIKPVNPSEWIPRWRDDVT